MDLVRTTEPDGLDTEGGAPTATVSPSSIASDQAAIAAAHDGFQPRAMVAATWCMGDSLRTMKVDVPARYPSPAGIA